MTGFVPAVQPACPNYSQCYASAMERMNLVRQVKEQIEEIQTLHDKLDAANAMMQVNVSASQFKRDTATFVRLQETEEIQRRANDHLEEENGRLRTLLTRANIDYTVVPQVKTEDTPLSPAITGFLGAM